MPGLQSMVAAGAGAGAGAGPVKAILIVRHGATKLNSQNDLSEDRIRGWTNVPLSPEGEDEAHRAAQELLGEGIEIILSSDLQRASETASVIANACHCPIYLTPILRPWHLGDMQGQLTQQALPIISKYVCDEPDRPVPGGESFHQFKDRALVRGMPTLLQIVGDKKPVFVTHHRDERLYCSWRDMGYPPDFTIKLETFLQKGEAPGAIQLLEIPIKNLYAGAQIQ